MALSKELEYSDASKTSIEETSTKQRTMSQSSSSVATSSSRAHLKRNIKRSEAVENVLRGKPFPYDFESDLYGFDQDEQPKPKKQRRMTVVSNPPKPKAMQLKQLKVNPPQKQATLEDLIAQKSNHDLENDSFLNSRPLDLEALFRIHLHLYNSTLPFHKAGTVKTVERKYKNREEELKAIPLIMKLREIGLGDNHPSVLWTIWEVKKFIGFLYKSVELAEMFERNDIDGPALLNLTLDDLVKYMGLGEKTAEEIIKVINVLKTETITKFVRVGEIPQSDWNREATQ